MSRQGATTQKKIRKATKSFSAKQVQEIQWDSYNMGYDDGREFQRYIDARDAIHETQAEVHWQREEPVPTLWERFKAKWWMR